jgi:nitrite reductase/ring-hydroxylating ferredoxin subunit
MMDSSMSLQDKIKRGSDDAGNFFNYMADFIGFDVQQAEAIFESRFIIEKYIPDIVADFYVHLLRYPPTRRFFLKPDGTVDQAYVQLRMQHLTNFWRRTAYGPYDEEYARYVDYVGMAHTRRGADPKIDIAEHYVIGQVAYMQHAISEALSKELHEIDPDWEMRATKAWNLLMMVNLEVLARAYREDSQREADQSKKEYDREQVKEMAIGSYEKGAGIHLLSEVRQALFVANEEDIPLGSRKIVNLMGLKVGVFHHTSGWIAIQNKCLHAGGPVAEGVLNGDVLTCPWHGFQYNLPTASLLKDPNAHLETYAVEVREGQVFVKVPVAPGIAAQTDGTHAAVQLPVQAEHAPAKNEFRLSELKPGEAGTVEVEGNTVAVFNIDGKYYAIDNRCTHVGGPLSEGQLDGTMVTCPWHGSCFDVTSGAVLCGPAKQGVRSYPVTIQGAFGKVG